MYKHLISFLSLLLTGLGTASAASGDTYVKVTQPSDLVVGGTYILAATYSGKTYVASGWSSTRFSTQSTGFSVDEGTIIISTASPILFTLGGTSIGYTLNYDETKYLGWNTSTQLKESTTVTNSEKWTYNYDNSRNTFLLINVSSTDRILFLVDVVSGSKTFFYIQSNTDKSFSSGLPPANLYRKIGSAITLSSACTDGTKYYGTYSNESAFVVPEDLTVSEIKVVDGKLTMGNYETGAVVPANTGVMVCSSAAGAHSVALSSEAGSSVLGSENMLRPSGSGITAEAMADADAGCKYYRLTMHNNETLGFYWGAADGAAFALGANKAYLAVPTGDAARLAGFGMTDGEATGIEAVAGETGNGETYNLLGQRVTADRAKGIVIRNGKKRVVK